MLCIFGQNQKLRATDLSCQRFFTEKINTRHVIEAINRRSSNSNINHMLLIWTIFLKRKQSSPVPRALSQYMLIKLSPFFENQTQMIECDGVTICSRHHTQRIWSYTYWPIQIHIKFSMCCVKQQLTRKSPFV